MRVPTPAALVASSVICWPTMGARLLSKASRNCSTSRRCWSFWNPTVGPPIWSSRKTSRVEEPEQGVDRSVVQEAEAADLRTLEAEIERGHAEDVEVSEPADLLVQVAQVRDLDDLLLVLEARVTVGAEVAEVRLEAVTALAGEPELLAEDRAGGSVGQPRPQEDALAVCLGRIERVVEGPVRVRRQRDLKREVGELLHVCGIESRSRGRPGSGTPTLKLLKELFSSNADAAVPGGFERSPRQCIAPLPSRPRRVCVVMGPFIGWKSVTLPVPLIGAGSLNTPEVTPMARLMGIGLAVTSASGLPRSQARSSMSPKM